METREKNRGGSVKLPGIYLRHDEKGGQKAYRHYRAIEASGKWGKGKKEKGGLAAPGGTR